MGMDPWADEIPVANPEWVPLLWAGRGCFVNEVVVRTWYSLPGSGTWSLLQAALWGGISWVHHQLHAKHNLFHVSFP